MQSWTAPLFSLNRYSDPSAYLLQISSLYPSSQVVQLLWVRPGRKPWRQVCWKYSPIRENRFKHTVMPSKDADRQWKLSFWTFRFHSQFKFEREFYLNIGIDDFWIYNINFTNISYFFYSSINTGVNRKVLPVLSTETLLRIWLSTEDYGFRPSHNGKCY